MQQARLRCHNGLHHRSDQRMALAHADFSEVAVTKLLQRNVFATGFAAETKCHVMPRSLLIRK
jgi:hypothetical protein